ncbi:hypothetical protein I4U23_013392 [Adineta vaga]|nr:hypothetical protein I4U23_013392 [Adineta vaga]
MNISLLLTCNTYLSIIFFCCILFDICIRSIYGHIHPSTSFSNQGCQLRAYFAHVCFCIFYYSFVLQAIFRLFRVVFYRKKILQSMKTFICAILLQWIFSLIFIFPHILFDDFQYQSLDYNCWISFRNLRGMFLAILTIYVAPLALTMIIYMSILRYVRQTVTLRRKRRRANKRDVIILRRILLLLVSLILIGIPTLIILIICIITDYLTPFAYDIQALNISVGLVITAIILGFITPKIRSIFRQNGQVTSNTVTQNIIQYTTYSTLSQSRVDNL